MSFNYEPSVAVLQALVKKPLYEKGMLAKALRIWVILRSLYGEEPSSLEDDRLDEIHLQNTLGLKSLPKLFSYADWYKAFFGESEFHPNNDNSVQLEIHDENCPCAKTIEDWLFNNPDFKTNTSEWRTKWCNDFKSLNKTVKEIDDEEVDNLLNPERDVVFKGIGKKIDSKKESIKQEYPNINDKSINLLFEKIKKKVKDKNTVIEEVKQEIYEKFSEIPQNLIDDIFKEYIKIKSEKDTHRPMWGTRKTFSNMLVDELVNELKFLEKSGEQYRKLDSLPEFLKKDDVPSPPTPLPPGVIPNLPNWRSWKEFFQKINGEQRFFIDLENIVPETITERVDSLINSLKSIWNSDPVPPIKLTYQSSSRGNFPEPYIVYPVCFYYIKRAPYLFAYGTTPPPKKKNNYKERSKINWYDYRIDKILNLEQLNWENQDIPQELLKKYKDKKLPTPKDVKTGIEFGLGYDFYKPTKEMIIRFDQYFYNNYIKDTQRNTLFKPLSLSQVKCHINSEHDEIYKINKKSLLERLETEKYRNSIYLKLDYYVDDNNVIMRLRSWSPKVEVILPWDLRKTMRDDIKETWKLYEKG